MGAWYWIGVAVGIGAALGVLAVGVLGGGPTRLLVAAALAAGAGLAIGLAVGSWGEAAGGAGGGIAGAAGTARLVERTLATGGTRMGTAVILSLVALVAGALALVPTLGYLEAVAVPTLGWRLRRQAAERYAGLRILR